MEKFPITILLDDIRSALNVGAIFRTCECAGVEKLILSGITPYPPHNRIPKTALGAVEMVDWEHHKSKADSIAAIKNRSVVSIEINENSKNIYDYKFKFPTVLIFGNEITGVSEDFLSISDEVVHLPMFGNKESLNVATTCGIVLYEIIRQLKFS